MSIRTLFVEDDDRICNTVRTFLAETGYQVDACADGNEVYTKFYENTCQLVILDIMPPGMNEHELLREFRARNGTPILVITALSDDEDQARALDAEADDYITKPFKMQILLKRVETLLRCSDALAKKVRVDRLTPLPEDFIVLCDGTELPLTRKELEVLLLLVQNKGRTLTHEIISSHIWGYNFEGDGSIVHTHIKNLRAKLSESIIKTIRGVGYRLKESQ